MNREPPWRISRAVPKMHWNVLLMEGWRSISCWCLWKSPLVVCRPSAVQIGPGWLPENVCRCMSGFRRAIHKAHLTRFRWDGMNDLKMYGSHSEARKQSYPTFNTTASNTTAAPSPLDETPGEKVWYAFATCRTMVCRLELWNLWRIRCTPWRD